MIKEVGLQEKHLPKNIYPIPVFFIKSPFFTPTSRNKNRLKEVRNISYENYYGYSKIKLSGLALNLSLDFKIFAALLKLRDSVDVNYVSIDLLEFCELIGHDKRNVSNSTKIAIEESFNRIVSQNIRFMKKDDNGDINKFSVSNIINDISISYETREVEIDFNNNIKFVFDNDKYVQYVNMDTYSSIKGEVAKALWLFYEANSKFTSFKIANIEKRLSLVQKEKKEVNRQIKKAHEELLSHGYLEKYDIINKNEYKILRHKNKR